MAKTSSSAQHYLECDNCEENPAQYFCKMCAGHLCETCKSDHGKRKITRNHEIVSMTSNNENLVDLMYCSTHTNKKLECYCNLCKEPVCTDCIIRSHNGHSVKSLSTIYNELTDHYKNRKKEIENVLLPKHREVLAKEIEKRSAFTMKADEIQKKIDAHTQDVAKMVKHIGEQTVESLRNAEKDGLREMDTFTDSIKEKINQLQLMSIQISEELEAKPDISFFTFTKCNELENFQSLPTPVDYTLTDFQPQHIDKEMSLGKPPVLQSSQQKKAECGEDEWVPPFSRVCIDENGIIGMKMA